MPVVDREKERQIVEAARKQGKSDEFIKSAILRFRERAAQQPSEPEKGGILSRIRDRGRAENRTQSGFGKGVGKGLLSTVRGASSLGEKMIKSVGRVATPKSLEKAFGFQKADQTTAEKVISDESVTPVGTGEKIGFGAQQLAEFLVPSSKIAKLSKGRNLLTRSAIEGSAVGGQTAIQQGGFDEDAKVNAIVGAMFPVVGSVVSRGIGKLKPVGEKIQSTVIRPNARDMKDGFKVENLTKYGVGGTTEEVVANTHIAINQRMQRLQSMLENTDATVDLREVVRNTQDRLLKDKASDFGNIKAIKRVAESLGDEVAEVAPGGIVDLVRATNVKRGAGAKGSWAFNRPETDASAVESVYTTFYDEIKKAIESQSPETLRTINKEISELIPLSNAALRRLPVEQRNNIISLTDSIGLFSAMFDPRALALIGANRLSKSGKFGQYLIDVSKKAPKSAIGKRFLGN